MNLRGLVSVSGRPGLFKLVGQNKGGYVLESLDEKKVKIVANLSNSKLASLEDITIYGEDDEIKLSDVFAKIDSKKANLPDAKADGNTLRKFFLEVAPGHDQEKVYASDMKKILAWYNLLKDMPLFTEEAPAPLMGGEETSTTAPKVEEKAEAKPKATKAKSTAAKATAKTAAPAKKATAPVKRGA